MEELTEVFINASLPSYNTTALQFPTRFLEYGLYKAVFRLQIETYIPGIEVYGEAFTYLRVIKSPLVPVMIEGAASKTARGWNQQVYLNPKGLSKDPDDPENKVRNYCALVVSGNRNHLQR